MRQIPAILALSLVLAACSAPPSDPKAPEASKPAATTEPAKPAPEAAAAKPAVDVPEGACGDQSALPKEQRLANTPRWTTASEVENFGYDVFRGDAEQGPFTKLTAEPMLGAGTTDETKKYEFRDDTIDPCKDYWYYVESISTGGEREKFTPVFKAPAKRRPAAAPAQPN
ncbi:hypothetical protein [Tahibacter amnicola]|uniref:Lipoprotein n=1 Tax=Tahibacter amnicola TaxID=2976241 RepID=A0ABY6BHW2_9GAMM|nr:hypothetical protein [Tahibacter amnicola]UXI67960.1 hypothetical protein N4264_25070 [Tahibacter amnicola]